MIKVSVEACYNFIMLYCINVSVLSVTAFVCTLLIIILSLQCSTLYRVLHTLYCSCFQDFEASVITWFSAHFKWRYTEGTMPQKVILREVSEDTSTLVHYRGDRWTRYPPCNNNIYWVNYEKKNLSSRRILNNTCQDRSGSAKWWACLQTPSTRSSCSKTLEMRPWLWGSGRSSVANMMLGLSQLLRTTTWLKRRRSALLPQR